MSPDFGVWIAAAPFFKQLLQPVHLCRGEIIAADQADAEAFAIMAIDMRTNPEFRPPPLDLTVSFDDSMIADPIPAKAQMHGVNVP